MQLRLEHQQVAQLLQRAASMAPQEACGLLGGKGGRTQRVVSIDNVAADPARRYEMDASQLVRALFAFEREGLELCAIWHSHPDGRPLPSSEDIRAAGWPDVCHLIVGHVNGVAELGAWHIAAGAVERVPLQIGSAAPDLAPETETRQQRLAIWASAAVAVLLALWLALTLLPPAPEIP